MTSAQITLGTIENQTASESNTILELQDLELALIGGGSGEVLF